MWGGGLYRSDVGFFIGDPMWGSYRRSDVVSYRRSDVGVL